MQESILFESTIEDGLILIPKAYQGFFKTNSLVTVKISAASKQVLQREALAESDFMAMKLDTKGWKFNRDEANERR